MARPHQADFQGMQIRPLLCRVGWSLGVLGVSLSLVLPALAQVPSGTLLHSIPAPPTGAQEGAKLGNLLSAEKAPKVAEKHQNEWFFFIEVRKITGFARIKRDNSKWCLHH